MCKPGMAEWAWLRNTHLKNVTEEAKKLHPDNEQMQQLHIQQKMAEFDGTRAEHDQMILGAIGGPGHPTI